MTKIRKKVAGSRQDLRSKESNQKRNNANSDTTYERGFSTDQRNEIENLNERRQERTDRQRETSIIGLSIE